ncbi:MAG: N-acetylmuramoyl-L-alanine amidase [Cyanobacteria bacterium REEB67]|nr:N-acetylmuramoyl-L-alanine amidase [Cyanobacteria bacterium REEB67]
MTTIFKSNRRPSFIASLCLLALQASGSTFASVVSVPAASAQAERAYRLPGNRVVSIDEGNDHHSLFLRLENNNVAGRPVFRYMAGSDGETVLTADFAGLSWSEQTRVIRLISSEKGLSSAAAAGIKEVRVGQFVDSPAVLRVSFVARDVRILKKVAIGAAPGLLKISWGGELANLAHSQPSSQLKETPRATAREESPRADDTAAANLSKADLAAVPFAPSISQRLKRSKAEKASRFASDTVDGGKAAAEKSGWPDSNSSENSQPDRNDNVAFRTVNPVASSRAAKADAAARAEATPVPEPVTAMQDEPAPTISLVPCDTQGTGAKIEILRVELAPGKEMNFKGFRLHDPERYVIDIPNCRGLADATLPDLNTSSLISSLRVGLPNQAEGVGRLVLQLTDPQVNVAGNFTPGSNYLSVTIGKGLMIGAESGQAEKYSSPDITPGPIIVPRAPSETVIVLDAGHGGTDPGAMRADIQEKDITLGIIEKLKKILETKGARIVLTRHDDTFVSLEDRVKITNQVGPNLFLSVHINSLESTSNIYGIETYFQTELSRPLAERVHASLVAGLAAPDRNIRRARFYVINHTPVPAILAEVGYITNKAERDKLNSAEYQQKIASALARGVMLYLQDTGAGGGQLANKAHLN